MTPAADPTPPEADDATPHGGHVVEPTDSVSADPTDSTTTDTDDTLPIDDHEAVTEAHAVLANEPSTGELGATQPIPTSELPETQPVESLEPAAAEEPPDWGDVDPVWAATGSVPEVGATATGDLPPTEPITEVWMETVTDPTPVESAPVADQQTAATTGEIVQHRSTAEMPMVVAAPARFGFRFGATTAVGILAGALTLFSLFATILSITSDTRLVPNDDTPLGFRTGTWIADDLADNLSVAGLIAALLMVLGGVAAGFRWQWGSGLAGGAGLAFAGIAAVAVGLAQVPIDAAHEMARIPSEQQFTLTITRDLGYWLLVAAGALGVVLFFTSVNEAVGDRRAGLNPWIGALGALAGVIAAAGPLLPENLAVFSDNWYLVEAPGEPPALLLVGRLVQLALLAMASVAGFLLVRRWGLGLAIGGMLPALWLVVSTLFELTDRPVGPGFRNPGAADMHVHGVTIIGFSALAAMALLAAIAAYDLAMRERR